MAWTDIFKHPKWQRKRLEIMERDAWRCVICHTEDKTLTVHHLLYHKGAKPWEYADEELVTLCQDCHLGVKNLPLTPADVDYIRGMTRAKEIHELRGAISELAREERQIIDGISPVLIRRPVTKTRLEEQIETLVRANDRFRHA